MAIEREDAKERAARLMAEGMDVEVRNEKELRKLAEAAKKAESGGFGDWLMAQTDGRKNPAKSYLGAGDDDPTGIEDLFDRLVSSLDGVRSDLSAKRPSHTPRGKKPRGKSIV